MLFSEKNKLENAENGHDSNGRTISVYVKTPGKNRIFIYNLYALNLACDRKSFFEKDIQEIKKSVLGDFKSYFKLL